MGSKTEKRMKKAVREATEIAMADLEVAFEKHWAKQNENDNTNKKYVNKKHHKPKPPQGDKDGN